MNTTPVRTTVLAATLLAATLTLGAGAQVDEPPGSDVAGAGVEPAQKKAGTPFVPTPAVSAEELTAIRLLYPTAGLEVPPADLRARSGESPAAAEGPPAEGETGTVKRSDRLTVTSSADRLARHAQ